MQVPTQITFRHMERSDSAEQQIRRWVAELEQFYPRITACHVVLEADHRHHHQGKLFHGGRAATLSCMRRPRSAASVRFSPSADMPSRSLRQARRSMSIETVS
jgi:hypothetical protein